MRTSPQVESRKTIVAPSGLQSRPLGIVRSASTRVTVPSGSIRRSSPARGVASRSIRPTHSRPPGSALASLQRKAVATIREIVNLLLLRGNIGRPGAGASPIRGHSNVQGDRTMGIWEKMPERFLAALEAEFGFAVPREEGADSLQTVRGLQRGDIDVFIAMGGNFVGAISDTDAAERAMRGAKLTVQVSTKLNRSHVVTGEEAIILPTLGRTEVDLQDGA